MRKVYLSTLLSALVLTLAAGCSWFGKMYKPQYDFMIAEVRVSEGTAPPLLVELPEGRQDKSSFGDDWLSWDWHVSTRQLEATLENRSPEPVTLRWNLASFKSIEGSKHRLIDWDVEYADRHKPKSPVRLGPGSQVKESVYPLGYHYWRGTKIVDYWCDVLVPQLPGIATTDRDKADKFGRQQIGKRLEVRIPVEGAGTTREYTFVLEIEGYTVFGFIGT